MRAKLESFVGTCEISLIPTCIRKVGENLDVHNLSEIYALRLEGVVLSIDL